MGTLPINGFFLRHLVFQGRIKGNILKNVNKHFGDWLLLHLLMKNIDRRTFQEIVNKLCNDKCDDKCVKQMKRVLTNISEDLDSKNNSSRLRLKMSNGDEEEDTESQNKFFLPGHGETRKLAVNFESIQKFDSLCYMAKCFQIKKYK